MRRHRPKRATSVDCKIGILMRRGSWWPIGRGDEAANFVAPPDAPSPEVFRLPLRTSTVGDDVAPIVLPARNCIELWYRDSWRVGPGS